MMLAVSVSILVFFYVSGDEGGGGSNGGGGGDGSDGGGGTEDRTRTSHMPDKALYVSEVYTDREITLEHYSLILSWKWDR